MKEIILFAALLLPFLSFASDETIGPVRDLSPSGVDGKHLFLKAKNDMDAGRYAEAVIGLSEAYKKLPVVGDYILLYLSRAHSELGNLDESNSLIKEILKNYPDSLLRKKARSMEIKNIISSGSSQGLEIFESYVKDYPADNEMKFLFAQALKNRGEDDKAKKIFKSLYVGSNGMLSKIAYSEFAPSDITVSDLIEKAANLMNVMKFKEAESVLREALIRDDGQHKSAILRKLGHSLFRQKKYKESAEIFEMAGEYYLRARALYRGGERTAFDLLVKELVSRGDKRAGALLMMSASEKIRNGEIDEALKLYKNIAAKYPSEAEDALWSSGWAYYRSGYYQKALNAFTELYSLYGSSKYRYWQARSLDGLGKETEQIYRQLAKKEKNFYGVLAHLRKETEVENRVVEINADPQTPILKPYSSERIDILTELGMKKEAAAELINIARKADSFNKLVSVSLKLQEIGEYKPAINLIAKMSYGESARNILYPLAYWNIVKEASEKHGVDPFIVLSVMREESRFDPAACSQIGALGLMQMMPYTAYAIDRKINLNITSEEQIYDVKINIALGSYYINFLIKEFGSLPVAVAAYNAGDHIVRKWQKAGNYKALDEFIEDIPYGETKNFTKRVMTSYFEYLKHSGEKELPKIL